MASPSVQVSLAYRSAMADEARKLLDSIMGGARNASKEERKKKKGSGDSFKEDSVCKYHLLGFCPQYESLFHNTRRDLGECCKTHHDFSREELNAHPDKDKYTAEYEQQLCRYLESHVRRADEWAAKERAKNDMAYQELKEKGPGEVAKQEIAKLQEQASAFLAEAETFASAGAVEISKSKVEMAEALQKKVADWTEKATSPPKAEVCEVCGVTKENEASADKLMNFEHQKGKVHQGFALIRKWHADLKERQVKREREAPATKEEYDAQDGEKGDKRRRRSRSRSGAGKGERREPDRERRRDGAAREDEGERRDRRGERAETRDRGDRGGRDRGGGGGGDRGSGRRRRDEEDDGYGDRRRDRR